MGRFRLARLLAAFFLLLAGAPSVSAQGCSGAVLYQEDFGGGPSSPDMGSPLSDSITSYSYTTNTPVEDGQYGIRKVVRGHADVWHQMTDHTGNGYLMLVNASYDPGLFYQARITGLCQGSSFYFSAWIANLIILGSEDPLDPDLRFQIRRASDSALIAQDTTGSVPRSATGEWKEYGIHFDLPAGESSVILQIYNNQGGGRGNDLALDDISFTRCGPSVTVAPKGTYLGSSDVCAGKEVSLNAAVGAGFYSDPAYQWQFSTDTVSWKDMEGETSTAVHIPDAGSADSGWYRLLVAENGNIGLRHCRISSAALRLSVWEPQPFQISSNSPVCEGEKLELDAPGGIGYRWEGPAGFTSTRDSLVFPAAGAAREGTYTLSRMTTGGCATSAEKSVYVQHNDLKVSLGEDSILCQGSAIVLNAANAGAEYLWNTGDETASITVDTAGFYRVTVRKGSCRESDSLRISEVLMPRVDLGPDTTICLGQAYTLDAEAPDVKDYLWADGSNLPVHAVSAAGTYAVTLSNSCGIASDAVRIRTETCANELVFPTAFTPNHDGRNDLFRPRIFLQISHYSLSVFDRWGRKVFQGTDAAGGWDGTEDGSVAPVGTYFWTAHYIIGSDHAATEQKGTVTLLR